MITRIILLTTSCRSSPFLLWAFSQRGKAKMATSWHRTNLVYTRPPELFRISFRLSFFSFLVDRWACFKLRGRGLPAGILSTKLKSYFRDQKVDIYLGISQEYLKTCRNQPQEMSSPLLSTPAFRASVLTKLCFISKPEQYDTCFLKPHITCGGGHRLQIRSYNLLAYLINQTF